MSEKPAILLTRKLPPAVEARAARDYSPIFNESDGQYDASALIRLSADADAILTCSTERYPAEVIARLPQRVKALATFSVGHDHIDLPAAKRRGLIVTNTPDVLTDATADVTILLLLAASRRAYEAERMLRAGQWRRWTATGLLGPQLTGKTLGILGMGRIGRAVAARARAFGMQIHYCNRSRLPPELEAGAIFHADPEDLLRHSPFLSLNGVPTPALRKFLNADRIALLPDGAVVVNTSRGAVIDDAALIAALKSGKIAAAGLDVYDGEPNVHPGYLDLPNATLLPHIGSATFETRDAMGFRALDNLDAVFAGREPPDRLA